MNYAIAAGGLTILMAAAPACAWDYASISSGMTVDQATQALASQNKSLTLFSERSDDNPGDVYLVEPNSSMLVHVCNGVVNGYSDILPGSIEAFVARAASEAKTRGTGNTRYITANEGGHQLNKMLVEWNEPDGSRLSLNWSSLNGVNYATIAMKAACPAAATTAQAHAPARGAEVHAAEPPAPIPSSQSRVLSQCAAKYRSFDAATGNYKDYRGRYRRCDLLDGGRKRHSAARG